MSNVITTPNMNLPNPVPGNDPGPDYADNIQSSFNIIDQHNHSSGSGVPINPDGISINASLPFNNNSATSLKSLVFTEQSSLATLNAIFVGTDGNLYFNDGASDPSIQITAGGVVNATSSGISSGTATASFVAGVLVVNAASNTPADVQCASVLIGNNSSGSKYLTLAPPAAMPANYSLTLPPLPAVQNIVTLDASGNLTAPWNVDNSTLVVSSNSLKVANSGIGTAQIADSAVTTAKINDGAVTLPKMAALSYQLSASSGNFSTTAVTPTAVTNLSVTIVCTGRPVFVSLVSDGSGSSSSFDIISSTSPAGATLFLLKNGSDFCRYNLATIATPSGGSLDLSIPGTVMQEFDTPGAGSVTYAVSVQVSNGAAGAIVGLRQVKLLAYEI